MSLAVGIAVGSGSSEAYGSGGAGRLWYLDWIRGYAMLLGVPFHVGLIYSTGTPWFVTSPEKSQVVSVITGWLTSFRMPLFFYVAGLLSAVVLSKRAPRAWLKRRIERLGVPLIVSTLVISPMVMLAMAHGASGGGDVERARVIFMGFFAHPGVQWVGHLWFLQVLLFYSLIAVAVLPVLDRLKPRLLARGDDGEFQVPLAWAFVAALAMSLEVVAVNGFFALAEARLSQRWFLWDMLKVEAIVRFLPYFLIGLFMKDVRLPPTQRSVLAWSMIAVSLVLMADHWNEPGILDKAIRYVCMGMLSVLGGCMILVLSAQFVSGNNRITTFLAASAFTVYLFHYPIVIWLGMAFRSIHWPPAAEYILLTSLTLTLTFLIHIALSGSRILTYLFNGERMAPAAPVAAARPLIEPNGPWPHKGVMRTPAD
jgi:glucan biosynthesis protein C